MQLKKLEMKKLKKQLKQQNKKQIVFYKILKHSIYRVLFLYLNDNGELKQRIHCLLEDEVVQVLKFYEDRIKRIYLLADKI